MHGIKIQIQKIATLRYNRLRPVYIGNFRSDFGCDFLILNDVKELFTWGYCYNISQTGTFITDLLIHIIEKEKIAPKIAVKIARVNGP